MEQNNLQPPRTRYDYTSAGFNGFMTRSIDSTLPTSLSANAPQTSRAMNFDRQSVGGSLGDTLQIGKIQLNGASGRISVFDDNGNEVIRIGELDD